MTLLSLSFYHTSRVSKACDSNDYKCLKVGAESNRFPQGWFIYLIIDSIILTFSHNMHSSGFDPSVTHSLTYISSTSILLMESVMKRSLC